MNENSRIVKYGIVCIQDLLGAKNFDVESAEDFLNKRDQVLKTATAYVQKEIQETPGILFEEFTFGDTIIFCWDLTGGAGISREQIRKKDHSKDMLQKTLIKAGNLIKNFLALGITFGLPYRGALSIGPYISEESTVIGPAVADAASWYEQVDWIGIIATPSAGFHIRELVEWGQYLAEREGKTDYSVEEQFSHIFVEYTDVPVKNPDTQNKMKLWVSPWPFVLKHIADLTNKNEYHMFSQFIANMLIPKGTELKYINTETVFRWYMNEKYSLLKINPQKTS